MTEECFSVPSPLLFKMLPLYWYCHEACFQLNIAQGFLLFCWVESFTVFILEILFSIRVTICNPLEKFCLLFTLFTKLPLPVV